MFFNFNRSTEYKPKSLRISDLVVNILSLLVNCGISPLNEIMHTRLAENTQLLRGHLQLASFISSSLENHYSQFLIHGPKPIKRCQIFFFSIRLTDAFPHICSVSLYLSVSHDHQGRRDTICTAAVAVLLCIGLS